MSPSVELQRKIYQALTLSAGLQASAAGGVRVYDRVPEKPVFPYVSFGPEDCQEAGADCLEAGEYYLQLDVWSRQPGKVEAKEICHAVQRALRLEALSLTQNALSELMWEKTRVMDDPDGLTTHGVLTVRAMIEERQ